MKIHVASIALASIALGAVTASAAYSRVGTPDVQFTATGPGGLKIVGKGSELNVAETDATITVTVPLASLDTGIELRNKHMREKYLEVSKYPNAELVVNRSALKLEGAKAEGDAPGTMKIHGQSKPVTFHYALTRASGQASVRGTVHVKLTDYGIAEPAFMGAKVRPDVDVAVSFAVKE